MKSLSQIKHDNRMTNRDFGSMCEWAVFCNGDFVAQFVKQSDAREFASNYEYEHGTEGCEIIVREATP